MAAAGPRAEIRDDSSCKSTKKLLYLKTMRPSGFFKQTYGTVSPSIPEDMTLVYESDDRHTQVWKTVADQRLVAVKTLGSLFRGDALSRERLRREYEIGINLKHPGICETLGWTDDCGQGPGIIMEWIDGDTLGHILDAGTPLPNGKIAAELCEAVAYIHHKQVIHKDLKPENILITRRGSNVKIIDFGLSDSDSILTGKEPAGTLDFAAPEVVAGKQADQSSDIYSLGKVLFRLGEEFQQVAAYCCAPDPKSRPANANEILKTLESGKRRNPAPAILIAAFLVAAAVLLAAVTGSHDEIKEILECSTAM